LLQFNALCEVDRRLVCIPEAVRNWTPISVDYRVANVVRSGQGDSAPKRDQ
jgi:hypothetical protein